MNDQKRKQILQALKNEKQGIVSQLKNKHLSSNEAKIQEYSTSPPLQHSQKEQEHQGIEESERLYNSTFNQYSNKDLLLQMRLTKEQMEEQEKLANQEMKEQAEEEEDDDYEKYQNYYKDNYQNQEEEDEEEEEQRDKRVVLEVQPQRVFTQSVKNVNQLNQQQPKSSNLREEQYFVGDNSPKYRENVDKPWNKNFTYKENVEQDQQQNIIKRNAHASCKQPYEPYNKPNQRNLSGEERAMVCQRLYEDKKAVYEQRENIKKKKESEEIKKNCSHTPVLSPMSQLISIQREDKPIGDRLNEEGKKLKAKIQQKQELKQKYEKSEFSFQPQIHPLENAEKLLPLQERFAEVVKRKQEILNQLQEASKSTFQPEINSKSKQIAAKRIEADFGDVCERLSHDYQHQQIRKGQLKEIISFETNKECKFKPEINPISHQIIQQIPLYNGKTEVYERQEILEKQRREKRIRNSVDGERECTFQPSVNLVSEMLVMENPKRATETMDQKIDRLYRQEMQKRIEKTDAKIQEESSKLSFKPSINSSSQNVKSKHLEDIEGGRNRIKALQEEKETDELRGCSFMPSTTQSSKYSHVEAKYSQDKCGQSIKAETQEKQRKIREMKKKQIQQEIEGCTFKPKLCSPIAINNDESVSQKVKGYENYLENKDKAERLKSQKQLKETQMFEIHKKYDIENRSKVTTPIPFNLSNTNLRSINV